MCHVKILLFMLLTYISNFMLKLCRHVHEYINYSNIQRYLIHIIHFITLNVIVTIVTCEIL